jgi:two-component sensor histidine kinase
MVFHELATNSEKYGALSDEVAGQVDICWQTEATPGGARMRLRWQESGGPPVTPPSHKGFGSRLIEIGLARNSMARSISSTSPKVYSVRLSCLSRGRWARHE